MKSFRIRRLAVLLMLGCAGGQTTTGSAFLSSALTLLLHAHEHSHSAFLVSGGGHLHLVLAHAEERHQGHEHESSPDHGELPLSLGGTDHVFHIASDEASTSLSRRPGAAPAAVPAIAVALPFPPSPAFPVSPEPRARGSDALTTVVLRL